MCDGERGVCSGGGSGFDDGGFEGGGVSEDFRGCVGDGMEGYYFVGRFWGVRRKK